MKSKLVLIFVLLLIVFTACKNKAVDISSFEITVENVHADSNGAHISGTYSCAKDVATMKINIGLDESLSDVSVYSMQVTGKDFSVALEGLNPGTKYYYCYSVNFGTSKDLLTDVEPFTTLVGLPIVKTITVQPEGNTGCQVTCKVTSDGGSSIIERGICWNTSGNPSIDDHAITDEHNGLGEYVCHISDVIPNTTYHIRAYAKNSKGVSYGEDMQFELEIEETLPEVQTSSVTGITATSAVCGGTVISEGSSPVTSKGVCWSTSPTPTISNTHVDYGSGGLGEFSVNLTDLTPNATYYVRAYATNESGTNYGAEESFVAKDGLPEVYTVDITDITSNSAVGHGKVDNDGGSDIIELGMCWSTSHNPNISNSHAVSSIVVNEGEFTVPITGLEPGEGYYVRAYAKNNQGVTYGEERYIQTIEDLPRITTHEVTNITSNSATVGGSLVSEGSSMVTEKGICWSVNQSPTTSGNHLQSSEESDVFSLNLIGLTSNTTYYVRAYAKNAAGTGYGNEVSFKTDEAVYNLPTVITSDVTNVTQNSATCGGRVTDDGGVAVTDRGVCWSTSPNPVVGGNATHDGSGTGYFVSNISGLSAGVTYYVRAYATNSVGTEYGEQKSFTTLPVPEVPIGALNGLFSVSATKRVWFSCGNLQYRASTDTWRFVDDQTNYVGNGNSSMSSTYSGWIDLFGWGTSNYDHGANKYWPWSTSVTHSDYHAYGISSCHLYDKTGKADWGYNRIQNGGNQEHYGWRTLTNAEWEYLFTGRQTASGIRFVKAEVNGVNGLILFPDDWIASIYEFNNANSSTISFSNNVINVTDWNLLQTHGAVFLPAGGCRSIRDIREVGTVGYYWSACNKNASAIAYYLQFSSITVNPNQDEGGRGIGRLVRLVYDKQ